MSARDTRWDASRLRAVCFASGLTDEQIVARLQELIEAANEGGSDVPQVRLHSLRRWRRGENEPRGRHLALLARVLGVDMQDLLPPLT